MGQARWPGPRRVAHRGGGTLAPENTLAALREAVARGYRAVEFDVMLTADGVPVLMHDPSFGRTIAGRGAVASTPWAELARRDAGGWFAPRFAGEAVPRYDDVLRFCDAHAVWVNAEIKPSPGREAETGCRVAAATAALRRDGAGVLLSSFSAAALTAARDAAPSIARGLLVGRVAAGAVDAARDLGCVSVHADHRRLDAATVRGLHDAGFAILAYTANDPARVATLEAWGVDAVCTDRIDLIAP